MEWLQDNTSFIFPFILFEPANDTHWSSGTGLFSLHVTTVIISALNSITIPLMSFGILANITNIIVFMKQGFKDSINVSLTSLTVSDLVGLLLMTLQTAALYPSVRGANWSFSPSELVTITASIPRAYLSRVSSVITMYLAIERCFSVIRPLQVRFIFTRKRLIVSLVGVYSINILPFIPSYCITRLTWKLDPWRNRTYLGVAFSKNSLVYDNIGMGIGIFILFSTFIIVAVCAVILVLTLFKQTQWRHKNITTAVASHTTHKATRLDKRSTSNSEDNSNGSSEGIKPKTTTTAATMSDRDKRAAKTVMLLAIIFVLCYFPGVVAQMAMIIFSEFNRSGRYRNAYTIFWLISVRAEGLCASVNIIVYFNTSTKFRETMLRVFCPCQKKQPGTVA